MKKNENENEITVNNKECVFVIWKVDNFLFIIVDEREHRETEKQENGIVVC